MQFFLKRLQITVRQLGEGAENQSRKVRFCTNVANAQSIGGIKSTNVQLSLNSALLPNCLLQAVFLATRYYQEISPVVGFVSSLINFPVTPSLSNKAYFTMRFPASSTSPPL